MPPQEEGTYLPDFTRVRAHLLLQGIYVDYHHHNDRLHLDGGLPDDAVWQHH